MLRSGEYFKLGTTCNLERRVGQLQVGTPFPISVHATIPCQTEDEALAIEERLGDAWNSKTVSGQWYRLDDDALREFARAVPSTGLPIMAQPINGFGVNILNTDSPNTDKPSSPPPAAPATGAVPPTPELEPLALEIPPYLSGKKADDHVARSPEYRCPICRVQITTAMDECPDCQRPVVWKGSSNILNRRSRRKAAQERDARARAKREAERARDLSAHARKVLLDAIEIDFSGDVSFRPGEAQKIDAYVAKYGAKALDDLLAQVKAEEGDKLTGRGLIIVLTRKMQYTGLRSAPARREAPTSGDLEHGFNA